MHGLNSASGDTMTNDTLFPMVSYQKVLYYFGGKGYGIPHILRHVPADIKEVVSPFLGGGSVELALTARGVRVFAYDKYGLLVNFWQQLLTDPNAMLPYVKQYVMDIYEGRITSKCDALKGLLTPAERAAMFLVRTNLSVNGLGIQTGMGQFVLNANNEPMKGGHGSRHVKYERIANFHNPLITVAHADFRESLARHPNTFAYLDPPYPDSACLYGDSPDMNVDFPHRDLADILHARNNWLLSYKDCDTVHKLYPPSDYQYYRPKWTRGSKASHGARAIDSDEVLITP